MAEVYSCRSLYFDQFGACEMSRGGCVRSGLDQINNMLVFLLRLGLPPSISEQPAASFSNTVRMQL
jgi:hypothetical protein